MPTVPRLLSRYTNLVELVIQDPGPDVSAFQFAASNTLDTAFAGATPMFTVLRNQSFRSPSIRRRKLGLQDGTLRGRTFVSYDPEDYWVPAGALPHDAAGSYVRVAEVSAAGVTRPQGPIMIVPPPGFFTNTRPNLTFAGTAPNVAGNALGTSPAGAMHIVLPKFSDFIGLRNTGGSDLYVSFREGMPEVVVPNGELQQFLDAAVSSIYLRGDGGTTTFTAYAAIVNSEMA